MAGWSEDVVVHGKTVIWRRIAPYTYAESQKKTHFRHRFNIIGDKGGLYGRSSRSIYIAPFNLSEVLDNLCKFDFIRKHSAYGKKEKGSIYRLTDLFSLYFLKFIGKKTGLDEHYWTNIKESARNSWCGYAFEQVCLHHIGFVAVEQIQISIQQS